MGVEVAPLDELVEDILDRRGVTPKKLGSEFCKSGHRVVSAKLMKDHRLDLAADEARYVDAPTYRKWMAAPIRDDDVLLTSEAPLGEVAYVHRDVDWCLGQRLFCIRTDKRKLHGRYLFYCLRGEPSRTDLLARATGTTVQGIRQSELRRVGIPVRPLPEQKRIAHVLGTLDDKIELNRRMNATLEGISRAIFKSWFVDFDPVRAKAAGQQPVGMDAQTAALFPDSFEDSESGEVPKGWQVAPLDQVADYLNGLALQKYPAGDGPTLPVIKIAQLRKGDATDADRCSDTVPAEYVIKDGDVLFSWSGSLEVAMWCGGRGALNQHLFKVTSQSYPKWFYYFWTLHHLADFRLIAADKATTMGHIQRKHLTAAKVVVPPAGCVDVMTRTMEPLLQQVIRVKNESRTLAALRDTLLPKLLSGEVRVPEAEGTVQQVLA